ncbi:acyltransferase family protein [Priestia megaterium]|uniref:acyltransferase family protein n=1 Tax=Priestia megaterium TaxID=1404 RepID=UPI00263E4D79|nr:acyltransferase [Sphingomonas sp. PsM26]
MRTVERDKRVDILRFIAIMGIIIAHSSPNGFILQLRNFDVTLMVLLLGTSFYLTSSDKKIKYLPYVKKRFERLVVPTWVFLTILFGLFYVISVVDHVHYYYSIGQIISSYMLISGIGYVWIMKVFFIIALVSPFILLLSKKIEDNKTYFLVIVIGFFIYAGLLHIYDSLNGAPKKIFEHFILQGLGYTLVAAIGIRIKQLTKSEVSFLCALFLVTSALLMVYHNYAPTQTYKYPPGLYYLSYGLFMSFLLYRLLDLEAIKGIFDNKFVYYISQNSLWLYFWHIIPVQLIFIYSKGTVFEYSFLLRLLVIFVVACILTVSHDKLSNKTKVSSKKKIGSVAK